MFPVFVNIKDKNVVIVGKGELAFSYAKLLENKVKKIIFLNKEKIDEKILEEDYLGYCTNLSENSLRFIYTDIRNSALVILASDIRSENDHFAELLENSVRFIATPSTILSSKANCVIGETELGKDFSIGLLSRELPTFGKKEIKELALELKKDERIELLKEIWKSISEQMALEDSLKVLNEAFILDTRELEDFKKQLTNSIKRIIIGAWDTPYHLKEAKKVQELIEEVYPVKVIIKPFALLESTEPFNQSKSPRDKDYSFLYNALLDHEIDMFCYPKKKVLPPLPYELTTVDAVYGKYQLIYYFISRQKAKRPYDIKDRSKIGTKDYYVTNVLKELYATLGQERNELTHYWDIELKELSNDILEDIERIASEELDGIILSNYDLDLLDLSMEELGEKGLNFLELDVLVPEVFDGMLSCCIRKSSKMIKDILNLISEPKLRILGVLEGKTFDILDTLNARGNWIFGEQLNVDVVYVEDYEHIKFRYFIRNQKGGSHIFDSDTIQIYSDDFFKEWRRAAKEAFFFMGTRGKIEKYVEEYEEEKEKELES